MPGKLETLRNLQCESDKIMLTEVEEHYKTFDKDNVRDITDAILNAAEQLKQDDKGGYELTKIRIIMTPHIRRHYGLCCTWRYTRPSKAGKNGRLRSQISPALYTRQQSFRKSCALLRCFRFPCRTTRYRTRLFVATMLTKTPSSSLICFPFPTKQGSGATLTTFDPGVFFTESGEINTSLLGHSLPFGLGRRRCVGEQLANISLFILFSSLMQQCRCSLPGSADLTSVLEL
ncbi:CP1A1-like protein, partial [Mya arenaria]